MTCIVGVETDSGVWIGGDSAAVSGWITVSTREPKVFANGDYLIGFTTSFRMGQLLRFADLPKPLDRSGEDLLRFMCTEFVDAVRTLFKDGGFAQKDSEQEKGGTFLVGVNGTLLTVDSNYMIGRNQEGYAACGSGWEVALGALHATLRLSPERRVRKALEAAAHHSGGVRAPFTILSAARSAQ
jgi:ATP-dependent protease HslVU (ClpYQ) peptidase subunit